MNLAESYNILNFQLYHCTSLEFNGDPQRVSLELFDALELHFLESCSILWNLSGVYRCDS